MNDSRLLVTKMRSEPSDARSDDSKMRSTTSLHSTNPKSEINFHHHFKFISKLYIFFMKN
ncbi:hypothetical protein RHMOL_Rhmol12G0072200 [Rhododendron molle]|nr:hypothetical protein RHMOL_Rhmol12G0072200 [Rhododendron molle]